MSLKIPVAHDFNCPWCYVALLQTERLKEEFDVEIEWLGYELWPAGLVRPVTEPPRQIPNKPPVPSRLDLLLAADRVTLPAVERPKGMSTHLAHLAAEFAKEHGHGDTFVAALYRAFWDRGEFINEVAFLCNLGESIGLDSAAMRTSIESEQFAERIIGFDAPAYASGVFNVPTFFIAGERYAEQPYLVIQHAVAEATKEAA